MVQSDYPGDSTPSLSVREAFDALRYFLEAYWERGGRASDDFSNLLSAMDGSTTDDGGPIDRAQWSDWLEAVKKAEEENRTRH